MFTRTPKSGIVIFHEVIETSKRFIRDITVVEQVCYMASAERTLIFAVGLAYRVQ